MCAIPDKAATEEFRKRKGPQRAYKVIRQSDATSTGLWAQAFTYRPGRNVDHNTTRSLRGYRRTSHGLHCYLSRAIAQRWCAFGDTLVVVTFRPTDVVVAERPGTQPYREIVVHALHISKLAWKQAGLPVTKGGGA